MTQLKKYLKSKIYLLLLLLLLSLYPSHCLSVSKYKFIDGTPVEYQGVPHLDTAISYLHVREATGKNDGVDVAKFLKSVGLPTGYAWCAAFVTYCLKVTYNTIIKVRSARALAFATKQMIPIETFLRQKQELNPGDIIVFRSGKGPYGHVEIAYKQKGRNLYAIGGNTNNGLSREGDGVYATLRTYKPYARLKIIGILRAK